MPRRVALVVLALLPFCVFAGDAAIARLFASAGVAGTLVIESERTGKRFVHDEARAQREYPAASSFKVLNTLIALEEGAIDGADSVIPWDGTRHGMAEWNRDQTLASAFKLSCVWCYQELARRVGADKYPAHIRRAGYGRLRQPFDGTRFWLDGSLTVSAEQQVAFLKQVAARHLPYRVESYDILKHIMLDTAAPGWRLYAKTGWASGSQPGLGWYVGYVETADDTWLFALNLDTRNAADLPLRRRLALEALRAKGIVADAVSVALPDGGCGLTVWSDGRAALHFGAAPRWVRTPAASFDFAAMVNALEAKSRPFDASSPPTSAEATVLLPGAAGRLRVVEDAAFVRTLLESAWARRDPPRLPGEREDAAWVAHACALE